MQLLGRAAETLGKADAGEDVEDLPVRMRMPARHDAGLEGTTHRGQAAIYIALHQRFHAEGRSRDALGR